jgi:hypothetical protein
VPADEHKCLFKSALRNYFKRVSRKATTYPQVWQTGSIYDREICNFTLKNSKNF